jgi:F-type H+-transporting ATPase subunit epsilon
MNLEIKTPEKIIFSGKVKSVYLKAADGEIGILEGHAPLATIISPGLIRYYTEKGEEVKLEGGNGFLAVKNNQVRILLN